MLYQRSLEIERRLDTVVRLIRTGHYSTPKLAERLGVSIPTVSRYVTALRERGYDIKATKEARGWRFVLASKPAARPKPNTSGPFAEANELSA
jgi:biotin operon repressor